MKQNLMIKIKLKHFLLVCIGCCIFFNSCKKEPGSEKEATSLLPKNGNPFMDHLFKEMLTYNLKSPILDTIANTGEIKWNKQLVKISSGDKNTIILVYPIVDADSICKTALEVSLSTDNAIRSLRIIRHKTKTPSVIKQGGIDKNDQLFYSMHKYGVKIPKEIIESVAESNLLGQKKVQLKSATQSAADCEYILNWDLYIMWEYSSVSIQNILNVQYYFDLFTRQYLDNIVQSNNPDFSYYRLSIPEGIFASAHNSVAFPLPLILDQALRDAARRMQYVNGYGLVDVLNYTYMGNSTCGSEDPTWGGGGVSGGDWPGSTTPVGGTVYAPETFRYSLSQSINLDDYFKCFSKVPSEGAGYYMEIRTDLPVNSDPSYLVTPGPTFSCGHSFITLTKYNGSTIVSQSFGFYPSIQVLSLTLTSTGSIINDNGGHEYDASSLKTVTAGEFDNVMATAKYLAANMSYNLTSYNCTDYAIEVFNSASGKHLSVADWIASPLNYNYGRTPNGLYKLLVQQKSYGDQSVQAYTSQAPPKSGPCN